MSYVAGRAAGPQKVLPPVANLPLSVKPAGRQAPKPAVSSGVEQLIMVEAAAAGISSGAASPSGGLAKAPAANTVSPALNSPPTPVAPVGLAQAAPAMAKPAELKPVAMGLLAGNTFWQVAATEPGMAEVTCEVLTRKGLPALLGDGPSPGIVRVLVGPVHSADESGRFKATLDEAGFHPFIKKY